MTLSDITNYIVNRFQQDEMVNTIALADNNIIDTKKETIYPLVTISFNGTELDEDQSFNTSIKKYDFTISVLQQRDASRKVTPSKLMAETNWIDNMNECDSICTNFINYVRRMEIDFPIEWADVSTLEPLNRYGGADLDGFRFDVTFSTPNTGYCS